MYSDFKQGLCIFYRWHGGQISKFTGCSARLHVEGGCKSIIRVSAPDDFFAAKLKADHCHVSIAEVNVGLMCCSLPVIFVLFRSLRPLSESAWSSVRDWLRARSAGSQDPSKISSGSAYPITFNESPDKPSRDELPQVPKGTLSGLMSFVRKGARSEYRSRLDRTTINQRTESHVELASIDDYNYHTYLNDRSVGVERPSESAYRPA